MNNERGDLPSASNAARYAACPGSHRACIGLPDTTSDDASRGDRIHAWLEGVAKGDIPPPLDDPEEQDVAERCLRQSGELIQQHIGIEDDRLVETRLWDRFRKWSGKADLVVIDKPWNALVIDYKTGRGDVESAEGNLQLRALAVLVSELPETWIESVTVAIVQPLAGPPSVCRYDLDALQRAGDEIEDIMAKASATNQPRNPGPWCQYCRAAGSAHCPESKANVRDLCVIEAAGPVADRDLPALLNACDAAEVAIMAIRNRAHAELRAGRSIEGWTLKPGRVTETITDPELVAGRFSMLHRNPEEAGKAFLRTVSIGKEKLKKEVSAVTGDKGKALDARMQTLLERATETKFTQPSLVRVKGGQP